MTNEVFRKAIGEALHPEFAAMIPEHGEHIFSEKFERKMEKLIRRRRKPYYSLISTGLRRAACIIVMFLVVSFTTVMSVEALRKPFLDFLSSIFSDHTTIESVLDLDGDYPETIEERYEITEGLESYTVDSTETDSQSIIINYKKTLNKFQLCFVQRTIHNYKNEINTEDVLISNVTINECAALFFSDNNGFNNLIWNNGYYILELHSCLGKNALIELAESVQKVE